MQRRVWAVVTIGVAVTSGLVLGRASHLNPLIDLHKAGKPVFGLYQPSNPRAGGGQGRGGAGQAGAGAANPATAPATPPPPQKTPLELAKDALAQPSDYIFNGNMERGVDGAIGPFADFMKALSEAGELAKSPARLTHPVAVKTPKIAENPAKAVENISRQLNLGVSTIVFVGVESAEEVKTGLAAMRFAAKGGTRPADVGTAPAFWGLSEADYRKKADVWPLNEDGELTNWTIVESKVGLAHLDEIAAVKGISVLFPGAGTLRSVFTTTVDGQRKFDAEGWEQSIQQVLAACKKYKIPCGYPANADDIEMRMKQGFSLFVINWGDAGFKAVDIGRRVSGRAK